MNICEEFNESGYIGPFDCLSGEEVDSIRATMGKVISNPVSPLYNMVTARDWHLVYRNLSEIAYKKTVVEKLVQLLGPDLIIWRTSAFYKAAGDGPLGWHQAHLFAGEEYGLYKPALEPPRGAREYTDLFCLSVWFAMDDVTIENGCVQVAKGTHRKQYPCKKVPLLESEFADLFIKGLGRAGDEARLEELSKRFGNQTIFEPEAEQSEVVDLEMKRGQFFIFTDRVVHGSRANTTKDGRLAINVRITTPAVTVYPHRLESDYIDGNDHDIREHACVILTGQDSHGKNVYLN